MHQRGFMAALFAVVACVRGRRPHFAFAAIFADNQRLLFRKEDEDTRVTRRVQFRRVRSYLVLNLARLAAFQYGSSKPPERFFFFPPGAVLELAL